MASLDKEVDNLLAAFKTEVVKTIRKVKASGEAEGFSDVEIARSVIQFKVKEFAPRTQDGARLTKHLDHLF